MNVNILTWVIVLPTSLETLQTKVNLEARRTAVLKLVEKAENLKAQAAELEASAYRESLYIESQARHVWTDEQINKAKQA